MVFAVFNEWDKSHSYCWQFTAMENERNDKLWIFMTGHNIVRLWLTSLGEKEGVVGGYDFGIGWGHDLVMILETRESWLSKFASWTNSKVARYIRCQDLRMQVKFSMRVWQVKTIEIFYKICHKLLFNDFWNLLKLDFIIWNVWWVFEKSWKTLKILRDTLVRLTFLNTCLKLTTRALCASKDHFSSNLIQKYSSVFPID